MTGRGAAGALDVGTGTGLVVEALLGRFDDIIAIDNDADMLAAADAALRPKLPNGTTLLLEQTTAEEFNPPASRPALQRHHARVPVQPGR